MHSHDPDSPTKTVPTEMAFEQAPKWSGMKEKTGKRNKPSVALGRKKAGEPKDFVLMLPIYDTRFWYHDLIGHIILLNVDK